MKICITSDGESLESLVDPRFGRAAYFVVVDTETNEFKAHQNPNVTGTGGVGIQSGQWAAEQGVKTVLTGSVGPNAFRTLESAGVSVVTGVSGTLKEALSRFVCGEFNPSKGPNAESKSGL